MFQNKSQNKGELGTHKRLLDMQFLHFEKWTLLGA